MRAYSTVIAIALGALVLGPRVVAAVTISDIVASPDTYDDQSVTVVGTVERSLPVGSESGYELRSGKDKLTVVSRTAAPSVGANLSVTGQVLVFHEGDGGPEANHFPPVLVEAARASAP